MKVLGMRPVRAAFLLFIVSKLADGKGQNNATSTSGLVDFIREAVWGDAKEGGGAYGQTILPRHSNLHPPNQPIVRESNVVHAAADEPRTEPPPTPIISSVIGGDRRDKARQLMKAIEVESDGRTVDENGVSNGACYVGACCGWGHRLMRQAKSFTHVHYLQNRTMLMEWGPCPNAKGVAGSGRDRQPDFSSIMIDDSSDILNFDTNECGKKIPNSDCSKCGAGNDISPQKWKEVGQHYGGHIAQDLGTGRSDQITAASFFPPFQYFARTLITHLKPRIKQRIEDVIATNFGDSPVIGVHHRHGNGEIDDFLDRKTGAPSGRLNKNNSKVVDWMVESISELASEYGLTDYKIFFATDSPEMSRLFRARDPSRVFIFDQLAKEESEGKGFNMPGWQGWGRSPGMSPEERHETCEEDTIRSFLDMVLLGYSDMLVISKRSTFTFFPSLMMAVRKKPVCMFVDGPKSTHFSCQTTKLLEKTGLVPRSKKETGLAPSSRL